jgi:hypothetical protein
MFRELYDNVAGDGNTVKVLCNYGSPEGVYAAGVGALYLRKDGSTSTTIYKKESGTGSTGWVAI